MCSVESERTYVSRIYEQMDIREILSPDYVPVLTRIFNEEMTLVATPDVKQRLLLDLQRKIAAENAARS